MKTFSMIVCLVVAAAIAFPPIATADAPTAQQVLDRWADAIGGRDALSKVNTVHLEYEAKMFGLDGTLDQWVSTDGRAHSHVSLGGLFDVHSIFSVDHGWYLDQNGKLSELAGEDLEQEVTSSYDATWACLVDGRRPGAVQMEGTEDGTGYLILRCEPEGGKPITYYIDPATGLPARSEAPQGDRTQTATYSEWKEYGGVMMPTHVVQSTGDPQYDATFVLKSADINATPPAGTFDKPAEAASGVTFTEGSPVRDIPIEFNTVHIFLRASVNDSKPLWFILDTGASITVLNTDVARELGFDLKGKVEGRGAGSGSVEVNLIPDVSVSLPGVVLEGQTVAAVPLADIEARVGRTIDGILGYDFISRFVVEIDYHGHTLTLYDRDAFDYNGEGTVVPIYLSGSSPQIDAAVTAPGGEPVSGNFLIDTGASGTVMFTSPFAKAHDLGSAFKKSFELVGGFGVGGESSSTIARLGSLSIGGLTFRAPSCALSHDESGALADPNLAGLIGGMILSRCTVFFDYDRKRMILEPNADFDAPFEIDWSGLILKTGGRGNFHTITVVRALAGSPAEDAGIKEGDVITSADGVTAAELTTHKLWKTFQRGGETVRLTIDRDGKKKEVSLKLKRRV